MNASITVKPLKWHKGVESGMWHGDGAFCHRYQIAKSKTLVGPNHWTFNVYLDDGESPSLAWPDTLAKAKAAAQHDYEQRILSALDYATELEADNAQSWRAA